MRQACGGIPAGSSAEQAKNLRLPLDFAGFDSAGAATGRSAPQAAAVAGAGQSYRHFVKVLS